MPLGAKLGADDLKLPEEAALVSEAPGGGVLKEGPGAHSEPERWALFEAAGALHSFLHDLDGDTFDTLAEYIFGELGDRGPRYVLGP